MELTERRQTLLGNRSFLALWVGQLISNLGDKLLHMSAIGFALAAHRAAGGAMAQLLIWATAPALVMGLVAGVVVDRVNRRSLMVASDCVRAALVASLPLAASLGSWAVCLVIALVASAACVFGTARTALIPLAVVDEHLVAANAAFAASGFVTALAGTVIGSWLLVGLGLKTSLWINAAVFGCSALAISLVPIRPILPQPVRSQTLAGILADIKHGYAVIVRHSAVRAMVLHYAVLMAIAAASYEGIVGLSGHEASLGLTGISLLLTAAVAGLVVGGVSAHRLSRGRPTNRLAGIGLSLIALGALAIAASASLVTLLGGLFVLGAGGAMYVAVSEATLQRIVPDTLRGRVLATRGVVSGLTVLGASALAGWLIDHAGKAVLFGSLAVLATVVAAGVALTGRDVLYRAVRFFFRHLTFAYLRFEVRGLEQIPTQNGAILAGNHPNVLDGLLLLIVSPRPVRFLVAEELYTHRYLHWLFKGMGCIPVYRTKTHNGDALRGAVDALKRGELLGIFPEGTTHYRGSMEQIKRGVALLALKTGVPVIPFGIRGSFEAFPPGTKFPRPRAVQMHFESPMRYEPTELHPIPEEQVATTLEDVRQQILWTTGRMKPAVEQPTVPAWVKELQVALSSLVVLPLAGFLTVTANPSLDPNAQRR